MAQQAELTSAQPAAVTVFINYRVRVVANRAEQFTRAEDGFPQVLAHLGFSWYLIEFVHVHNFTSFLWTVPSGLDYPNCPAGIFRGNMLKLPLFLCTRSSRLRRGFGGQAALPAKKWALSSAG